MGNSKLLYKMGNYILAIIVNKVMSDNPKLPNSRYVNTMKKKQFPCRKKVKISYALDN